MADLMGSYIPDLVLKIDHSDLMQLTTFLPKPSQGWWNRLVANPATAVTACTSVVTAFTSITTVLVLISNRKITKEVSNSNHELSRQNTETAKENKEIAKRKYNLDVINKRWSFLQAYLDGIDIICRSIVMEFTEEFPEKIEIGSTLDFYEYRLKDLVRKKKSYNEIKSYDIIFKSFLSLETEKYFQKIEQDIEILFHNMSKYKFDENKSLPVYDLLIDYENHLEEYKNEIYHSRAIFTSCFIGIELDGMKLMN